MTRKPLGRGLGALLSADQVASEHSLEIDIDLIDPSAMQPRTQFGEAKLEELAKSIESNGIVQPLLVRQRGARYELIAGERRWRAAKLAGLSRIPAVVRDVPDSRVLELALIENIQREDLNAIEEAQAYKKLIEAIGLTQETLAERVGRDRSYITNYLRLLRLPKDIQLLVQEGKLSTGHARALLGANDVDLQRRLARRIIERGLSVRDIEKAVRDLTQTESGGGHQSREAATQDPNVGAVESRIRRRLGTKVRIVRNQTKPGGKIELDYQDLDDLDRLYRLICPQPIPV